MNHLTIFDYITGKSYCDKVGHDRAIMKLCLNKSCIDKRYICLQCQHDGNHRQHARDCFTFEQLKEFIQFYGQPDKLNQRLQAIFLDYKQRIIQNLHDIETLISKIMAQRDIGTINRSFLSSENRKINELDQYAQQLSKLVKQNEAKIERDNNFLTELEDKMSSFYQNQIKAQLTCLQSLVSDYSRFTLIEAPIIYENKEIRYGLQVKAFERFIYSRRYMSPKVRWKDDFIVKGSGTAILEPPLDLIYYNQVQVRLQLTDGLQGSIGVCTIDESVPSLMGKMFLIQSDGYIINSNNQNQNYQKKAFNFSYNDIIYCCYNRQNSSFQLIHENVFILLIFKRQNNRFNQKKQKLRNNYIYVYVCRTVNFRY